MLQYLLQGMAIGLSAGLGPGPLLALFMAKAGQDGWRRTLPAAFAPLASDIPILILTLLLLARIPDSVLNGLRIAGGLFMLYLAFKIYSSLRMGGQVEPSRSSSAATFRSAVLVNLLNPNPYIFWATVLGPVVVRGWRVTPLYGILFALAFYAVMIGLYMMWIVVFGSAGRVSHGVKKTLGFISAAGMAAYGLWQILSVSG